MEISIDNTLLTSYNISEEELLVLYLVNKDCKFIKTLLQLRDKKYITKDSATLYEYNITNKGKEALTYLLVHGNKDVISKEDMIENLAIQLKDIYPKGKKPGTNYLWRSNTVEIARRLKVLIGKYKFEFTPEQAIEATKNYVASFNGDYRMMRLLKYFIFKLERDAEGNTIVVSDMMSLIENEGQETNQNWTTTLV